MRCRAPILLALLLATAWSTTRAQPVVSAPCPYSSCAVRLQTGFLNEYLVRGDTAEKVLKVNFTGSNVADYLARVESAAAPARQFRSSRVRAAVLGIIGGAALGYVSASVYESDSDDSFETDDVVALAIGIPASIWGGIEAVRSRNAVSRAIWEFNQAPVR